MKKSYLNNHTLVLLNEGEIIYRSQKKWLYPLWECIHEFNGKINNCTLYDRIIGVAASKLIQYSGIIQSIYTPKASRDAINYIEKTSLDLHYDKELKYIEKSPGAGRCKAESLALDMSPAQLYEYMKDNFFNE